MQLIMMDIHHWWGKKDILHCSYKNLFRAASFGDIEQVKLFLQQGADINVKEYNFEKTALKIAEEMAKENVVELLKNL